VRCETQSGTCCIPVSSENLIYPGCDPGFGMTCCGYPNSYCISENGVGVCRGL
jgi:hypothetical protein